MRFSFAIGLALLAALVAGWMHFPVEESIRGFSDWVFGLGPAGFALFLAIYVAVTLAMGPAWALSVAAGLAFGLWALLLVVPSAVAAALVAFVVARHLVRHRVAAYLRGRARLSAVDRAVKEHGVEVVLLMRLSPLLPFGAKSYLFGASRVSARAYLIGTAIGVLPGSTLWVMFGAAGQLAAREGPITPTQWALLALGLAATGAAVWLVQKRATRKLKQMGIG